MLQRSSSASFPFKPSSLEVSITIRPPKMYDICFSIIVMPLRSKPVQQKYMYFFIIFKQKWVMVNDSKAATRNTFNFDCF